MCSLPYTFRTSTGTVVTCEDVRFLGEGTFRYAFLCTFRTSKWVLKVPKSPNDDARFSPARYDGDVHMLRKADQTATLFNGYTQSSKPIKFVTEYEVVQIMSSGDKRLPVGAYAFTEEYLDGEFQKFNNNVGWVSSVPSNSMPALSHYSYVVSDGDFLLCDLQGVRREDGYHLTDPAFHTRDQTAGCTDRGVVGFREFFRTHVCNILCKGLGMPEF